MVVEDAAPVTVDVFARFLARTGAAVPNFHGAILRQPRRVMRRWLIGRGFAGLGDGDARICNGEQNRKMSQAHRQVFFMNETAAFYRSITEHTTSV